ncbi:hypothetical protein CLV88_11251 [Shimia abyssi]|uniref:Uncharacterized protein n=1 Tax=Shimia abyssi TaxID=1662395 RepID=A0A2P8F8S9_9RHOB|nr:hypothetical protein CLV88_11251 [Shimia abyssi]
MHVSPIWFEHNATERNQLHFRGDLCAMRVVNTLAKLFKTCSDMLSK